MKNIAVLVPCYNEEKTVAGVVRAFREQLPDAAIYVYDNNSTDNTAAEAGKAGAIVRSEKRQGKGNVIRSMFRQIEADIYIMVDGDGTYPADKVHSLIKPVADDEADMVIGSRLHSEAGSEFRALNKLGNRMFLLVLNFIFRTKVTDLLSGYRVFSRNVLKSLPVLSAGFEIETELTVKAIERRYRILEVPVSLSARPEGSQSKINTFRDGILILSTIFALFRDYKPFTAFGSVGLFLVSLGLLPGIVVIREYIATGYIYRVPSAILSVGLVLSGLLAAFAGLILHAIARRFQEMDYQLQNISDKIHQPDAEIP